MAGRAERREVRDEERADRRDVRPVALEAGAGADGIVERLRRPDAPLQPGVAREAEERRLLAQCEYLHLESLLHLQPDPEELRHHDELLFIITHQSFELWFKLALHEIDAAIGLLDQDRVEHATALVRRTAEIFKLAMPMMALLERMTPPDFFEFRAALSPASGTESIQFREIEIASGLRDAQYRRLLELPPDPRPDLAQPQGIVQRQRMRDARLIQLRRHDPDVVGQRAGDLLHDLQAGCVDAVVIGAENSHPSKCLLFE